MRSSFSDALNWLEALVSSVSLVCAIEESISRVSELAMAVKKFAYDDRSPVKELDVHDSLQSTITILGHKLRIKQIAVEKKFEASPSVIQTRGSALSQVWTNLIDNAADASPEQGQIEIATWTEACERQGRRSGMAGGEHYGSRAREFRRMCCRESSRHSLRPSRKDRGPGWGWRLCIGS